MRKRAQTSNVHRVHKNKMQIAFRDKSQNEIWKGVESQVQKQNQTSTYFLGGPFDERARDQGQGSGGKVPM